MKKVLLKKGLIRAVAAATLAAVGTTGSAATCYVFASQIQATTTGPYTTSQNTAYQTIAIRDPGARTHSFELLFQYPGDLNGFGTQAGAIELMTNSVFARNEGIRLAQSDLGTIQQNADASYTFTLDSALAFQLPSPNVFTVPGVSSSPQGLGGICLLPGLSTLCQQTQQAPILQLYYLIPTEGNVTFAFPGDNTIRGWIYVNGYVLDNPSVGANYSAQFVGWLQASQQCP